MLVQVGPDGRRAAALPLGDTVISNIQAQLPVRSASPSGHETDSKSNKELSVVSPVGGITLRERKCAVCPPNWIIVEETEKRAP